MGTVMGDGERRKTSQLAELYQSLATSGRLSLKPVFLELGKDVWIRREFHRVPETAI